MQSVYLARLWHIIVADQGQAPLTVRQIGGYLLGHLSHAPLGQRGGPHREHLEDEVEEEGRLLLKGRKKDSLMMTTLVVMVVARVSRFPAEEKEKRMEEKERVERKIIAAPPRESQTRARAREEEGMKEYFEYFEYFEYCGVKRNVAVLGISLSFEVGSTRSFCLTSLLRAGAVHHVWRANRSVHWKREATLCFRT